MVTWAKTRYTGVRFWQSETRKLRGRPDRCYVIRFKSHGKTISETVGWASEGITQEFCSNLRGQITANIRTGQGFQSLAEKRALEAAKKKAHKTEAVTLDQAFQEFLKTRTLKDRTVRDYKRSMEVAFQDWKTRRVIDITRDSVAQRHKKLGRDQGAAQANQHMRFLRSLLNFVAGYYEDASGGPLIKFNPVQRLSQTKAWFKVDRRRTIIKTVDLPKWFKAVQGLENKTVRDYLIFTLLTGSRKREGLTLETEQVDLQNKTYTVLDPKNRQPVTLPLPKYLYGVLEKRIEKQGESKYVFPGDGPKGHFTEPKRQITKIIEGSKVRFTLHDLRRGFITTADALDLSVFAIKQLVNHSTGQDTTAGYVISNVERLREPMQKIENRLLVLAKAKKAGKVVPIRQNVG